jgi:hypothetical protein
VAPATAQSADKVGAGETPAAVSCALVHTAATRAHCAAQRGSGTAIGRRKNTDGDESNSDDADAAASASANAVVAYTRTDGSAGSPTSPLLSSSPLPSPALPSPPPTSPSLPSSPLTPPASPLSPLTSASPSPLPSPLPSSLPSSLVVVLVLVCSSRTAPHVLNTPLHTCARTAAAH